MTDRSLAMLGLPDGGGRVLLVAPHPDDDVLGAGATMHRLAAAGVEVRVVIVAKAQPPRFDASFGEAGEEEAIRAHAVLGVAETTRLGYPLAELDQVPHADVNAALVDIVATFAPHVVFLPFADDLMLDHQLVALSTMVAARPLGAGSPGGVYAYETLSQSNWNAPFRPRFAPSVFVDVADHLDAKVHAMACFESQLKQFPHERSLEAVRALATLRGANAGLVAAEGFVPLRVVVRGSP